MWSRQCWRLLCSFVLAFAHLSRCHAKYTENIVLRPLFDQEKTVVHYEAAIFSENQSTMHYHLFPKGLGQTLRKYDVEELSLTFSQGKWNSKWGSPFVDGPFGVQLQARVRSFHHWEGLTRELGGMFSVSLGKMDASATYNPNSTYARALDMSKDGKYDLYHAILPRESLCTENIMPWIKLLPCRTHSGIGAYINSIKILGGDYISMNVHATNLPNGDMNVNVALTVVHLVRDSVDWTLQDLFDVPNSHLKFCPLSESSLLHIETNPLSSVPNFLAEQRTKLQFNNSLDKSNLRLVTLDLKKSPISLAEQWINKVDAKSEYETYVPNQAWRKIKVHRYLTGYGQVHGGLSVVISNSHANCPIYIHYHDSLPWYLRTYYNTLKIAVQNKVIDPFVDLIAFNFTPGERHRQVNTFEFQYTLPPQTEMIISLQFEKAFLPAEEHPPDGNRGFDIPSSILRAECKCGDLTSKCDEQNVIVNDFDYLISKLQQNKVVTIYTEPLLVPLPTPDFSMPYNVITLTSTIMAFFLGSMLNTLLRRKRSSRLETARKELASKQCDSWQYKLKNFFNRAPVPLKSSTKTKTE